MSESSLLHKMLDAAEILQYARKFRGQTSVLVIKNQERLENLAQDLSLLCEAGIKLIIISQSTIDANHFQALFKAYSANHSHKSNDPEAIPLFVADKDIYEEAFQLALSNQASKVLVAGLVDVLMKDELPISHLTPEDFCQHHSSLPVQTLAWECAAAEIELVVLQDLPGQLFNEVFTHLGSGNLVRPKLAAQFRPATLADVADIYFLILPYIRSSLILPTDRIAIAKQINDYLIYLINDTVFGTAKFSAYDSYAEIGKICTLPRYRGQGWAKKIILAALPVAKERGFSAIFALSITQSMWKIFESLGFSEISRENLPDSWKNKYDSSRPSKAFIYYLK